MKNSDILSTIIRTKLEIAQRVITLLPEDIRPLVKEAEKAVLTAVRDELSHHLQQEKQGVKDKGLKKVEVD